MDNQQVTEFEIGWLVGIFDGEGCYSLFKRSNSKIIPGIKFVNTNLEIIDEVCSILNRLQIGYYVYNSFRTANQQPAKRLEINGMKRIKRFFDILFPRLRCRVDQAKLLRDFVELRLSKGIKEPYGNDEFSIYYMLRNHNRRGNLRD